MFFRKIFNFCKEKTYQNLVKPIIQSKAPVDEAALGLAVGVFVGLTPTVGVQMWLVCVIWFFCRCVLKIKFDLVIGVALVWISNPLTMFFMYYGFLVAGYSFFSFMGIEGKELTYQVFHDRLSAIVNNTDCNIIEIFIESSKFFMVELGHPMVLGSLFYAVPLSIVSYFFGRKYIRLYRVGRAQKMGMDYNSWKEKFERC